MTTPDRKPSPRPAPSVTRPADTHRVPVEFEVHNLLSNLLRRSHFAAEAEFAASHPDLEVTSRQLALLFAINQQPGGRQVELAEIAGFDQNTFSDLAKRSERKGLVKRVRSLDDRRAFGLYLTAEGRQVVAPGGRDGARIPGQDHQAAERRRHPATCRAAAPVAGPAVARPCRHGPCRTAPCPVAS